jgi:hypothetical protein
MCVSFLLFMEWHSNWIPVSQLYIGKHLNQQMYDIKTCPLWLLVPGLGGGGGNLTIVFILEYVIHTLFKCRLDCHLTRFSSMETSSEASFRNPGKKKWWKTLWVIMLICYEKIHLILLAHIHSTGWREAPQTSMGEGDKPGNWPPFLEFKKNK